MKKKILPLLLIAAVSLTGCTAGKQESYSTKVKTSDEQILASTQFGSGDVVANVGGASASKDDKKDKDSNASSSGNAPNVWFINNANGIGWSAALTTSMNGTFDTDAYDYTFVDGQGQFEVQIEAMNNAIADKADVICLDPIQEDGFDDVLKAAKDAGCKVFLVDRKVSADESLYEGWLGSNFDLEGENAGKWLVEQAGGKKMNIVVLQGGLGASAQIGRHDGFNRIIEQNKNFTILAEEIADFDKAKAKVLMSKYLDTYGDKIDVIVTHNDTMCYGVIETLTEKNIDPNDYIIMSFDGEAEVFKLMVDNAKVDICVECNPLLGPATEKLVAKIVAGETIDKTNYVDEGVFTADVAAAELPNRQF